MNIITALGNEKILKKLKENGINSIIGTDIQYQEAVLEILEKNKNIELLILSGILPGEFNIYEFINLIKYKNSKIEIMIILEKEDEEIKNFLVSKGINNIYYNNKITLNKIIQKINEINNTIKIENKINYIEDKKEIINKIKKYIINKINLIKNKKINKNNKKIISIIGAPKVGKTIFSLILSLNIKNKKILIINFNNKKNNIEKIIGKKIINKNNSQKIENKILKWKKNIDILIVNEEKEENEKNKITENFKDFIEEKKTVYDYIFIDIDNVSKMKQVLKKSNKIILLVEANLLGIDETRDILREVIIKQKKPKRQHKNRF